MFKTLTPPLGLIYLLVSRDCQFMCCDKPKYIEYTA